MSVYVNTKRTGIIPDAEIADKIGKLFDLRPAAIIRKFGLKNPIYSPTAAYGHFGRPELNLPWEQIRKTEELRAAAGVL